MASRNKKTHVRQNTMLNGITPSTYSPLSYIGGKTKLWGIASKLLPDVTEMASPFLGGGALELSIAATGVQVYAGDLLKPLVNFWKHFLADPQSLAHSVYEVFPLSWDEVRGLYPPDGDTDWKRAGYTLLETDYEKAYHFWIMNKLSWSGKSMISFGYPGDPVGKEFFEHQWDNWHNPYLHVEHEHWRTTIESHPEKFLYLDPPYVEKEEYYGLQHTDRTFNHVALRDALLTHKAPIMLSYGDHPYVHELYADFLIMTPPKWFYSTSAKMSSELLILNNIGYDEKYVRSLIESTNRHTEFLTENARPDLSEQLTMDFATPSQS